MPSANAIWYGEIVDTDVVRGMVKPPTSGRVMAVEVRHFQDVKKHCIRLPRNVLAPMDAAMDGGMERTVRIIFSPGVARLLTLFCQKSDSAQVAVPGTFRGVYVASGAGPSSAKSTARPSSTSILLFKWHPDISI